MIEYRKANIEEIDLLAKVRVEFLCNGKDVTEEEKVILFTNNKQYFYSAMADGSFTSWIALDEGKIIATSGLSIYVLPPNQGSPNGRTAYISNMYTIEEYRGRGIATKLFSLTVDEAKARGCEKILLNATDMGQPIYQKYGFEDQKGAMAFYPYQ
jgi:GNAT superfamily N-acetyltransferase